MIETKIFAHRGASGLVPFENTIDAFNKAIELKCDGIETDIRKTKDDVIIINHNPDIGGLLIKDHTYEELCNKTKEIGYPLCTLEECMKCVKGKMFIDIEFKEPGYEKQALDIILKYLKLDEFYVRSFNPEAMVNVKKINPDVYTILLVGSEHCSFKQRFNEIFPGKFIKKFGVDGISPNEQELILGYIGRMRMKKVYLSAWTVNDPERMEKLMKKHIPCIITNYPDKALEIRNKLNNK